TDPEGWSRGRGWSERGGLRGTSAPASEGTAESSQAGGFIPSTTRATGLYPQRRWRAATARDTDLRGQDPAEGGKDGDRSGVRAGLPGLFVRVPTGAFAASGAGSAGETRDVDGWWLAPGPGHQVVFRHGGPWEAEGDDSPAGTRWRHPAIDRQVVTGGCDGGGVRLPS